MTEKDRSQLLRMAGNIACGLVTGNERKIVEVADESVRLAYAILKEVDRLMVLEFQNESKQ